MAAPKKRIRGRFVAARGGHPWSRRCRCGGRSASEPQIERPQPLQQPQPHEPLEQERPRILLRVQLAEEAASRPQRPCGLHFASQHRCGCSQQARRPSRVVERTSGCRSFVAHCRPRAGGSGASRGALDVDGEDAIATRRSYSSFVVGFLHAVFLCFSVMSKNSELSALAIGGAALIALGAGFFIGNHHSSRSASAPQRGLRTIRSR